MIPLTGKKTKWHTIKNDHSNKRPNKRDRERIRSQKYYEETN